METTDSVIDWLELEKDILELIILRLNILVDLIRFSAVCKTWRSIFLENCQRLHHHLLPILIIPKDEKNDFRDFFSLSEKQTYYLENKATKCCFGSSEGCLIMIDNRLNISLLNPFSKTETRLPSLTSLSHIINFCEMETGTIEYTRRHFPRQDNHIHTIFFTPKDFVHKAVTAGPYVVAILGYRSGLAFCRRDGDTWTYVKNDWFFYEDVVCYNGNFYAVDQSGVVVVVDVSGTHPTVTKVAMGFGRGIELCRKYLVEYCGELLMVERRFHDRRLYYSDETWRFEIYKVDVNKHMCFPLKDLGDGTLFLGENCSVSLSALDFSGCKRNCIYFADYEESFNGYWIADYEESFNGCWHRSYVCAYNVENGSIKTTHYKVDWNRPKPRPIWLTPKP